MAETVTHTEVSWHPFTPRGVAGAARAPRWQMWVVLGVTAVLSALVLAHFLAVRWAPVVVEAISKIPDGGYLRKGVYFPGGLFLFHRYRT